MNTLRSDPGPPGLARNYLQGCLLLLVAEAPAHGYELLEQLAEVGLGGIDSGAVYRALRTLNDEGLLQSHWETSSAGPARRTYRLTPAGAERLGAWARQAATTSRFLESFVVRHRGLAPWGGHERAPATAGAGVGAGEGAA